MIRLRIAAVLSMVSLAACAADPGDEPGADANTLTFATANEAMAWLATKAPAHPGVSVVHGSDGAVQNIRFDDVAARDGLLEEFKSFRAIRVAGEVFDPAQVLGSASSDTEERTSAITSTDSRCSAGICISASSTNKHTSLFGLGYHEVGAATSITQGSSKSGVCPIVSSGWLRTLSCSPFPGYSLVIDPDYPCKNPSTNPSGFACVKKNGTESIGMNITYFTNINGTPTPILTEQVSVTDRNFVGKSYIALGTVSFNCGVNFPPECEVHGVCTAHSANSPAGSVSTSTASGFTTCQ